jgi:RHS repeat-associated protein
MITTEPTVSASDLRFAPSRCTNKERDSESGNDYFGARYYASTMGRFLSPDWSAKVEPVPYSKLDDPQTLNLYSYVGNNPLARADADGHEGEQCCDVGVSPGEGVMPPVPTPFHPIVPWDSEDSLKQGWKDFTDSVSSSVKGALDKITSLFSKQAAPGSRPGQDFTRAGKRTIDKTNAANHGGDNKCDECKKKVRKVANEKGKPTPDDQLQRHHIDPKANGGSGTPENGQVLCPDCHQAEHAPQPKPTPQPNQ